MRRDQQGRKDADSHPERGVQEPELARINKGERMQTHKLREGAKNLNQQGSIREKGCRLTC
jgi:hypothetical protein